MSNPFPILPKFDAGTTTTTTTIISLDEGDSNPINPDFVLNDVPIPFAVWQNMQLLKDTYELSKELTLQGYRETTILAPNVIRQLLQLHAAYGGNGNPGNPHPYITLKRPLRDARLENLLPGKLVRALRELFVGGWNSEVTPPLRQMFWNVYAACHILYDKYMFEYISAFLASVCRDVDPPIASEITRRLVG